MTDNFDSNKKLIRYKEIVRKKGVRVLLCE